MTSPNTMPADLDEIKRRLNDGDKRMLAIERAVEENTRITRESSGVIGEIRDALAFARVGTKIIKWLGGLGAVVTATIVLITHWKKP